MIRASVISLVALTLLGCASAGEAPLSGPEPGQAVAPAPISFSDLLGRPRQKADEKIAYGADPLQFGELWLPVRKTDKPLPVVVLVHGGCWLSDLPGTELMDYIAANLRDRGYAVWNVEYRRIGYPGGGYPGTFQDVARGIDHLRAFSRERNLDLDHVVFVGHSAGGHLVTWAAGRNQLPTGSPLRFGVPLMPRGVVSLAGINDLESFRADGPGRCGGPKTIDDLVDAGRTGDLYADTSPARLGPATVPEAIISGALDPIVPPPFGDAFAARAGRLAKATTIPASGHFELIDPTAPAWTDVIAPRISALIR